jgi:hypothetical protein
LLSLRDARIDKYTVTLLMTHIDREKKKDDLGRASVIFFDPDKKSGFFSN